MTEVEWLQSESFGDVVYPLREVQNSRKWRLFAVACVRQIWHLVPDRFQHAVNVAERFAERKATQEDLASAWWTYRAAFGAAERAACWATCPTGNITIRGSDNVPGYAFEAIRLAEGDEAAAALRRALIALLRDIFGNPFRSSILDPAWLRANDGTVERLACGIAEELCFEQMPILGDALEDAGCSDAAILEHCRGPGPHVHGCWVIDLLMGKL
jgi:hypothetical protein